MSDPWVKFYASDWLGGTSGLTAAERGVYITLLALMYEASGPIVDDRSRLARRCGLPAGSFKRVLDALIEEGKIIKRDDCLFNSRAKTLIGERENERTKRQSGAHKTNAILKQKKKEKQGDNERSPSRSSNGKPEPEPDISSSLHSEDKPDDDFKLVLPKPDELQEALDIYHQACDFLEKQNGKLIWPKVEGFTPARKSKLKQRLSECGGVDGWKYAMRRAVQSSFLTGVNDRGWRASFTFFCQQESFTKLREGAYDDRTPTSSPNGPNGSQSGRSGRFRSIEDDVLDLLGETGWTPDSSDDSSEQYSASVVDFEQFAPRYSRPGQQEGLRSFDRYGTGEIVDGHAKKSGG